MTLPPAPDPVAVTLPAASTALLLLDVTDPMCAAYPRCRDLVPRAAALLAAARRAGALVLHSANHPGVAAPLVPPPFAEAVAPAAGEPIVIGGGQDRFFATLLDELLRRRRHAEPHRPHRLRVTLANGARMKRQLCLAAGTLVFLVAAASVPARAADTIAAIADDPAAFDGKPIDVTGYVRHVQSLTAAFESTTTHWYRVVLCNADDDACIIGVRFEPVKADPNRPARVTGIYWWSRHDDNQPFIFEKVLQIKSISQARAPSPTPRPSSSR